MGPNEQDLKEKARLARDAVADLDEPLKTEAFKMFLAQLLSTESPSKSPVTIPAVRPDVKAKTKSAGPRAAKPAKKAAPSPSSLKLDVTGLRKLGEYCERFAIAGQGTEQIAFVLTNFLRENTDLDFVTAGDIAYLYRQLISLRVKVAAVNSAADWTRALGWLTAPSRRKEWLEKRGDGYVVSNAGLLRWHELESEAAARSTVAGAE